VKSVSIRSLFSLLLVLSTSDFHPDSKASINSELVNDAGIFSHYFRNETGFISIAKWYISFSKLDKRLNCQFRISRNISLTIIVLYLRNSLTLLLNKS